VHRKPLGTKRSRVRLATRPGIVARSSGYGVLVAADWVGAVAGLGLLAAPAIDCQVVQRSPQVTFGLAWIVWTRRRFGEHYSKLNQGGLDEDRLRFYQLCMHLNLVAGPLRIADTSHPEHEWFRWLAEHHLQLVLQFQAMLCREFRGWPRHRGVSAGLTS
jgi:hypothetical protein